MKPLQLDIKDLNKYRTNESCLYAKDGTKELRLTFYGSMQIWKDGVKIFEDCNSFSVIDFFNNI